MNLPYCFRICACLPGGPVIELFRAHRRYAQADWNFWTRELSPEWIAWTERPMLDRECITSRPVIRAPHVARVAGKLSLYPANPHQEVL